MGSNNLGNGNKLIVDSVELEFRNGTLKSDDGKTLPYLVCPTYGVPGERAVTESFTEADIGKQFKLSIYISKEDYENTKIGTYTGKLKCTGIYTCHPYSSDDPDASSPNFMFETKKFRGSCIDTIPLRLAKYNFLNTGDTTSASTLMVAICTLGLVTTIIIVTNRKKGKPEPTKTQIT